MAKRKRQPGSGSKLRLIKDYRDPEYVLYLAGTETGILEAWTMEPDLRDGDVRDALRNLIKTMQATAELPPELTGGEEKSTQSVLEWRILGQLKLAFDRHGPLPVEDVIGILREVNSSVGTWNRGMRGQEYLKYIKDFLGGLGVEVRQLTDEEVLEMGLLPSEPDDDDDSIEGDYHEIKSA